MAYDESVAVRVRASLAGRSSINERKMFGGLAFVLSGNMCCCVTKHGLMVRVGPDAYEDALAKPHTGVMDLTGRPMRGMGAGAAWRLGVRCRFVEMGCAGGRLCRNTTAQIVCSCSSCRPAQARRVQRPLRVLSPGHRRRGRGDRGA